MKKFILLILPALCVASITAQTKMRVWSGNGIAYEQNIAQIDSITFAIENTEGALSGEFSVSSTKKVRFSKGSLQYQASTNTWRFAEHQWDYVGDAIQGTVYENGEKSNNALISMSYSGWIDLFGFSTSSTYFGVNTSGSSSSYSGEFIDWGINIGDGWRTLSKVEIQYLLSERENARNLYFCAIVNDVKGVILLPDNGGNIQFSDIIAPSLCTLERWNSLEAVGAVFLPAAGYRDGTSIYSVQNTGDYYASTAPSNTFADGLQIDFSTKMVTADSNNLRYNGRTVRLVYDTETTTTTPATPSDDMTHGLSVSADKKVQFSKGNLQYQASTNTWRFAEHQYDVIGSANSNISATYSGWIDLFGWGTGMNPTYSQKDNSSYRTFVDWGTNKISNTENESVQWRTLTADEWKYIFFTRINASTLFGVGKVNGVSGTIVLPDDWSTPQGISFTPSTSKGLNLEGNDIYGNSNTNNFSHNIYSLEQWKVLEDAGAIFLPAGGLRNGLTTNYVGITGDYWSSTAYDSNNACSLGFDSGRLLNHNDTPLYFGRSVRLVRDVK